MVYDRYVNVVGSVGGNIAVGLGRDVDKAKWFFKKVEGLWQCVVGCEVRGRETAIFVAYCLKVSYEENRLAGVMSQFVVDPALNASGKFEAGSWGGFLYLECCDLVDNEVNKGVRVKFKNQFKSTACYFVARWESKSFEEVNVQESNDASKITGVVIAFWLSRGWRGKELGGVFSHVGGDHADERELGSEETANSFEDAFCDTRFREIDSRDSTRGD